jgi:hypothetical protein
LYRGAEIGVGEARTTQLQPGGDALEKYAALLPRHATHGRHNNSKLSVV